VSGTDTGVGKTMVTAAIAVAAAARGLRVAVLKPAQTGIGPGSAEESDVDTVIRLAAPTTGRTLCTYADPLAPATAARVSGLPAVALSDAVTAVRHLGQGHDLVLVEGAGGLLVDLGGWTVADLAGAVAAPVVVVTRAGLGTLNHTALTLEALANRNLRACVVIGEWPAVPELVHLTNSDDLPGERWGVLPAGAGHLDPAEFRVRAPSWLAPQLHGYWTSRT
jgi:dethiobiotin synthetase